MSEIEGRVNRGESCHHYTVWFNGYRLPLCYGNVFSECGISGMDNDTWDDPEFYFGARFDAMSHGWGYCGEGPEMLSITLLAMYAGLSGDDIAAVTHWEDMYKTYEPKKHRTRGWVAKHYRAFTSEVISNLPDNWTMTMEEIDAWVKDGTLPACITNQLNET